MSIKMDVSVKKGDKVVANKQLEVFGVVAADVDDVFEVKNVLYDSVCVATDNITLTIDNTTFNEHFEKYDEPMIDDDEGFTLIDHLPKSVTPEDIEDIMENSEIIVGTAFDKCTVVSCKLPNGFIITESSACVDPENYDEEIGIDICMKKITDKVWELEGYLLQNDLYTMKQLEEEFGLNAD